MQRRFEYLDLLRILAVGLVMFGHYVLVAGGATAIPGIINPTFPLPLIDQTQWQLPAFETFLLETFSTQTAVLGVTLFFLVTGYLMPIMMERYSRRNFLINRFFRIFPALFVATLIVGLFVRLNQDITFNMSSYLASWTLTYLIFLIVPVIGVLWTLVIEILFYLCVSLMGKFSIHKVFALQVVLLTIILISIKFPNNYYLMPSANNLKYVLMITIGSAIFLAEKEPKWPYKISLIFIATGLSYLGFQLYQFGHLDTETYNNLGTQVLALTLFLTFYWFANFINLKKLPSFIFWLSDLVYPIYLLHAAIGLGTMAALRPFTTHPYVLLSGAIISSILLAWLVHSYIEKPSITIGKKLTQKMNVRSSA